MLKNPPTFLFTLQSYQTEDIGIVWNAVYTIWTDGVTQHDLESIAASGFDFVDIEYNGRYRDFLDSLTVEFVNYKVSGAVKAPSFNIFATSPTKDPAAWTKLRKYLASLQYASSLDGIGKARFLPQCQLCYSITHPRGLCPFSNIPNWYGGGHIKKKDDRSKSYRSFSPATTRGRGRYSRFN
ncbi:hypothetical protein BJ138DRAFT_1108242 [Hygrophoropsis aurantiaca]|uniref:Uncharacterized protein n=1 Tax=Hygrophoropsis aurantiaca TaxID=72124 RepID=A0ACB7ZNP2_9AGAM|nr:hypothetical protein BJ138DRAFT_1108242 [Hygrophoropsis aurantiaca]